MVVVSDSGGAAKEKSMMVNTETLLPPGFRFHPTDEELILHYLRNRAASLPCPVSIIAEVDIYKFDPWDLPAKAVYGDREWYFFSPRDRKYPNGVRPNRAAGSGYWKATGTDKVIVAAPGKESVGVKKALVFYKGRPPKGIKTNWIMHEYRMAESPGAAHSRPLKQSRESMRLDDWVLCRIYNKCSNPPGSSSDRDQEDGNAAAEDAQLSSAPFLAGGPPQGGVKMPKSFSFSELFDDGDYSVLARLLCDNPLDTAAPELGPLLGHAPPNPNSFHCGNGGTTNFSLPKLSPKESPPSAAAICFKRQRAPAEDAEQGDATAHPPKKHNSSCNNYTNMANLQLINTGPQCNMLNPPMLHQQILLNSHLGLH